MGGHEGSDVHSWYWFNGCIVYTVHRHLQCLGWGAGLHFVIHSRRLPQHSIGDSSTGAAARRSSCSIMCTASLSFVWHPHHGICSSHVLRLCHSYLYLGSGLCFLQSDEFHAFCEKKHIFHALCILCNNDFVVLCENWISMCVQFSMFVKPPTGGYTIEIRCGNPFVDFNA